MQERDIQIKGHKIRLNLDVIIVATANPEDYTNRGRIITPLKDRYGAQIRTHYPDKIDQEIIIIDQEYKRFPDSEQLVKMPSFMKEIIAEITHLARKSPEINQRSGVSLRVSIANYETLISQAYRRGIVNNYATSPRISELKYLIASSIGKLELETVEEGQESKIIGSIIDRAVLNIFLAKINPEQLTLILEKFETGLTVDVGENILDNQLVKKVDSIDGLRNILYGICNSEEDCVLATTFEFVLEGLHQTKKIGKAINDKSEVYTI
jgi:magnesium chelatase subunit I